MTSTFLAIVTVWEIVALSGTVLLSTYLIAEIVIAILRPWPAFAPDPETPLPFVSVVIPTYDEPEAILAATLACWDRVRYPAFEVLLADDSTVPAAVDPSRVRVVRRPNREGFKGGALRNAFNHLDPRSEWLLVFDADYLVDPDVLVRFAEHYRPGVGGIQGFMSMGLNDPPSTLTRFSEAIHHVAGVLLAGRYRHRGFVGVQGTVQAYRVEAIRDLGGIAPSFTANEDLDTSFRLRKAGWTIVYDPRIVGYGVAPDRYETFFTQITRWTATTVREYRRHWRSYLASPKVPRREKLDSFLFLLTWTNAIVVAPTLFFIPWALLDLRLIPLWSAIAITLLPLVVFTVPALLRRAARTGVIGWLWYYVMLLPGSFVMFRAAFSGLLGEPGFARTPKSAQARTEPPSRAPAPVSEATGATVLNFPVRRYACRSCGRSLADREVVFYASAGLDLAEVDCRRCLADTEWSRFRPTPAAAGPAPA